MIFGIKKMIRNNKKVSEEKEETLVNNDAECESNEEHDNKDVKEKLRMELHILTDRSIPGLMTFFNEKGLNVKKIYSDIAELRDEILMSTEPARIVIIDTGTGKFSLVGARKNIIDLMGISDEEEMRVIVFYTDSVIMSEAQLSEKLDTVDIEWVKYQSTSHVIMTMLMKLDSEEYIRDGVCETEKYTDGLEFKGLTLGNEEGACFGSPIISKNTYIDNISDIENNEKLQEYEVIINGYK